jgi:ABC-type glycerol-3-phosphate transport system permease component
MQLSKRTRVMLRQIGIYAAVLAFTAFALFPFLWMVASSVKPPGEIYTMPPRWIIDNPTLQHYTRVIWESNMPLYFWNTLKVAGGTTLVALCFAISAGYGFARFQFRGKGFWSLFVLIWS